MGDLVRGLFPSAASPEALLAPYSPPWQARQRLWWLLWSRCPGIGIRRLRRLLLLPGGLEAAWALPVGVLAQRLGWPRGLGPAVEQFRGQWGCDPLSRLAREERAGRCVLMPGDRRWPQALEALDRPPPVLYWRGRGSLWAPLAGRQAVAVVGTRHPSSHGLLMANRVGAALAAAGWPVVSGLAEGIDGAAHEGCLAAGGAPVGVIGTPLDRTYPRHHRRLQQQVASEGLLLSEWPLGAAVRPGNFASRNRLQVALARALVLVECPEASGALHSADLAWAEGLPLWVVPADASRLSALGSNRLLARGATPLLLPADLIDQLGPGPLAGRVWSAAPPVRGERLRCERPTSPTDQAESDAAQNRDDPAEAGGAAAPTPGRSPGRARAGESVDLITALVPRGEGRSPRAPTDVGGTGAATAIANGPTAVGTHREGKRLMPGPASSRSPATAPRVAARGPTALGAPGSEAPRQEQLMQRRLGSAGCRLLAAVGVGASLEQLSEALGLGAEQLAPVLLDLELAGVLRAEPGLRWRPAATAWQPGSAQAPMGRRAINSPRRPGEAVEPSSGRTDQHSAGPLER